jgi:hypothetical protein
MEDELTYNEHLKSACLNEINERPKVPADFSKMKSTVMDSLVMHSSPLVQKLNNLNWEEIQIKVKVKASQEKGRFFIEPSQIAVMHLIFNDIEEIITRMHSSSLNDYYKAFNKLYDNHKKYHFYSSCLLTTKFNSQFGGSSKPSNIPDNPFGFARNSMITRPKRLLNVVLMEGFMKIIIVYQIRIWQNLFTTSPLKIGEEVLCPNELLYNLKCELGIMTGAFTEADKLYL